ncbi:MAG: U32 family peptidase [Nitrospirales bacterium]|nr:U32 family peptidase [Nitrospirales bacterium]
MSSRQKLELLSPARNLECGIEAINHGADAVYIGGPVFGARAAAGNTIADIEQLAVHAHRYSGRVYVALNTILRDDELDQAQRIVRQVYEAGADALIVQDMGLLELDLPPIALHASTQTDNRTVEKVRFLEQSGFSQVVLARELSLDQIREIAARTSVPLEFFIHGALCVSYSGQCFISHALTGRSANRGECSQLCRLPYTLTDSKGKVISRDRHLLCLRDNNQTVNLRSLVEAGITSFKIEGRLKDISYVKNITAHYRRLLDGILEEEPEYRASSAGKCTFFFESNPAKSFNRGFTDYFVRGRQKELLSQLTPKFIGEPVGRVVNLGRGWFETEGNKPIHNGDGLTFFTSRKELKGLRINRAEGNRLFPAEADHGLTVGTELFRNRDQEFERQLERKSAERKISVQLRFSETPDGFSLEMTDEEGIGAAAGISHEKILAQNAEKVFASIGEQLGKLGNTIFTAKEISLDLVAPWFIPVSVLNSLRREAAEKLEAARLSACRRPARADAVFPPVPYPETELSYRGNVYNQKAREFYAKHGVTSIAPAFEADQEKGEVSLMITRHCLRYSLNLCPKQSGSNRPDPLFLTHNKDRLTLHFDCKRCEMHVTGKRKSNRP